MSSSLSLQTFQSVLHNVHCTAVNMFICTHPHCTCLGISLRDQHHYPPRCHVSLRGHRAVEGTAVHEVQSGRVGRERSVKSYMIDTTSIILYQSRYPYDSMGKMMQIGVRQRQSSTVLDLSFLNMELFGLGAEHYATRAVRLVPCGNFGITWRAE